ncbi:esterase family protein [Streptomyces sp. J2-1]|uniref:alpha/beta hydrolase n=1 Tax=Streptomyces corallincola TaxID=2851888 RepID=UPI001C37FAE9|nr:alpha/beta hydrolase-fold protein [Streptomyces corallincola]MBV2353388.1 esterase family protein [Streptomyces corallincola]
MSLTGTSFLYTSIALAVVALLLPLVLWSRMRGPKAVRIGGRVLMLLFAQCTAITLVFVMVNNQNNLYSNWSDLLGTGDHVQQAANLGTSGTGDIALKRLPRVVQHFEPASGPTMGAAGGVEVTQLKGQVSGVDAEVYVWLPPQYHEAAYRHTRFPVVEVLPGYPGSATAWFGAMHAHQQLLPEMESGKIAPFILVAPRTSLLPDADTGCANVPGQVNADSWLSVDVPRMVTQNFRAQPAPDGWATAGYSAGAHCAVKLAVAHPDRYRAAISMSGYNDPAAESASLAAHNPVLRAENNPYLLLRHYPVPPRIALYISGEPGDGYESAEALAAEAKAPTSVHVVYLPRSAGGHTMALWRPQVVPSFRWLTEVMGETHVGPAARGAAARTGVIGRGVSGHPAPDPPAGAGVPAVPAGRRVTASVPRSPSNAGSTPVVPASGTASPAVAARTP